MFNIDMKVNSKSQLKRLLNPQGGFLSNIHRKTPAPESLFKLQLYLKRDSDTGGIPVNFARYLWMTASILQQLLALCVALIYSWQLSSSKKSLVGKKFIYIFQRFYRFRFLLRKYIFFHFL